MKPVVTLPSAEFLRNCFDYLPETGELIWKARPREHFSTELYWKRFLKTTTGKKAGILAWRDKEHTHPQGVFVKFRQSGKRYMSYAHRIIFLIQGVDVPEGMFIDHRNGNAHDNSWENLRLATPSQNACNKRKAKGAGDMPKGVSKCKGVFFAQIMKEGKITRLGLYSTPEKAHFAYCEAAREIHGEFFRAG